MKKILTILFTVLSCAVMAQKPVQTLGNKGNIVKVLGELGADSAILFPKDTIQLLSTDRGLAFKGANLYQWDGSKWILVGSTSTALNNGLVSTGDITLVDSTLTINDTIRYTINGVDYIQIIPSTFIINSADSGYYRKDLIYADATGLYKVVGVPNMDFGVKPKLPVNAIEITTVDIYGQQIATPVPVIITPIPNLQQVTNAGNSTTNPIFINSNSIQTPLRITSDFNRSNYLYFKNRSNGNWANTGFLFKNDVTDDAGNEWSGHWFRLMQGSTNSDMIKDGAILMTNGSGGMKIVADSGRITFNSGSPAYPYDTTSHPYKEMGAFETDGSFKLNKYKNNATLDSVLGTDENGLLVMKKLTDSVDVSFLKGDKIDTSHLPVSKLYIQQAGAGETHIVRAANDTALSVATLKNSTDITASKNADSSISFNFTVPHYTKDQVDSIAATLTASGITRAELIDTADNKVNKTDISGGTINQVLKKNSSTDYDWSWQDEAGGGKDSSAYHTIQALGDTALVICDLQGRCDTTIFSAHTVWSKNGNYAYYNTGNVGIGTNTPTSQLTISGLTTATTPDSIGILLMPSTVATAGAPKSSPKLTFMASGWNTTSSKNDTVSFGLFTTSLSSSLPPPTLNIERTINGSTITVATISSTGAITANLGGGISSFGQLTAGATSATSFATARTIGFVSPTTINSFSSADNLNYSDSRTSGSIYRAFYVNPTLTNLTYLSHGSAFENVSLDNAFNTSSGSTVIGGVTPNATALLDIQSTSKGLLIPRMTKTQRNAITSPAPGLMVIVTGETGGEYLSWYNSSTSGWVKVTSTAD